jgi:hypothetical protein
MGRNVTCLKNVHSANMKGNDGLGEIKTHMGLIGCIYCLCLIHSFLLKESGNLRRSQNTNYLTYIICVGYMLRRSSETSEQADYPTLCKRAEYCRLSNIRYEGWKRHRKSFPSDWPSKAGYQLGDGRITLLWVTYRETRSYVTQMFVILKNRAYPETVKSSLYLHNLSP